MLVGNVLHNFTCIFILSASKQGCGDRKFGKQGNVIPREQHFSSQRVYSITSIYVTSREVVDSANERKEFIELYTTGSFIAESKLSRVNVTSFIRILLVVIRVIKY